MYKSGHSYDILSLQNKVKDQIIQNLSILNSDSEIKLNTFILIKNKIKQYFVDYFKSIEEKLNKEREDIQFYLKQNYQNTFGDLFNFDNNISI